METSEIVRLLYSRNQAPRWTEYGQAVVEKIATEQGITFDGLGEAIFQLAFFLEDHGNKGMYAQYFEDTLPKGAVENPEHAPAWENILFQEREGRWFVRKKPHWSLVWGERYGWQTAPGQSLIARHHDEALATHTEVIAFLESQKPKRLVETIAGKPAEELTTLEVAYVAAVAHVLYERYTGRYGLGLDTAPGLLRWHYRELQRQAIAELDYRLYSDPEERSSKKKTEAAKADWAKAGELLKAGTGHFFSKAFIEQAVENAAERIWMWISTICQSCPTRKPRCAG